VAQALRRALTSGGLAANPGEETALRRLLTLRLTAFSDPGKSYFNDQHRT
jgi:hypothetical protein